MVTICVILYVLIGYVVAVAAYSAERQKVSKPFVDLTFVWLCGCFWPLAMIAASVVHIGEKLNSKT